MLLKAILRTHILELALNAAAQSLSRNFSQIEKKPEYEERRMRLLNRAAQEITINTTKVKPVTRKIADGLTLESVSVVCRGSGHPVKGLEFR